MVSLNSGTRIISRQRRNRSSGASRSLRKWHTALRAAHSFSEESRVRDRPTQWMLAVVSVVLALVEIVAPFRLHIHQDQYLVMGLGKRFSRPREDTPDSARACLR